MKITQPPSQSVRSCLADLDRPMSAGSCLILRQTPRVHFAGSCADLALGNRRIVLGGVAPGTALSFHIEGLLGHAFEAEKPISPPCYLLKGAGGPKQPLLQHGSHVVVPGVVVPTTLDELVPQRFNDFTASIQPVLLEQAGLLAQLTNHEPAPLSTTSGGTRPWAAWTAFPIFWSSAASAWANSSTNGMRPCEPTRPGEAPDLLSPGAGAGVRYPLRRCMNHQWCPSGSRAW